MTNDPERVEMDTPEATVPASEQLPTAAAQVPQPVPAALPKPKRLRGFTCPNCRGVRLFVYRTRRPCAGKVVRYRQCSTCTYRTTTEEKFGHVLPASLSPEEIEQARRERVERQELAKAERKEQRERQREQARLECEKKSEQARRERQQKRQQEREQIRRAVEELNQAKRDTVRQRRKRVREMGERGLTTTEIARVLRVTENVVAYDRTVIRRELAATSSSPS